jgi:hypothetical protein
MTNTDDVTRVRACGRVRGFKVELALSIPERKGPPRQRVLGPRQTERRRVQLKTAKGQAWPL